MRVSVNEQQRIITALLSQRPANVPPGTIFYAEDTGEMYVFVEKQWHSMSGNSKETATETPWTPEMIPMNPQRRFKYECPNARYERNSSHDTVDFFWDGIRNMVDPASIKLASLYDECQSGKSCRCSRSLQGGEIFHQDLGQGPSDPVLEELKNISTNLQTLFGKVSAVEAVTFALGERMNNQQTLTAEEVKTLRQKLGLDPTPPTTGADLLAKMRKSPATEVPATPEVQATTETQATPVTEGTDMEDSKLKKVGRAIKADAADAAWRVGASQATRTAKAAIVAGMLQSIPKAKKDLRRQLAAFFATPYGDAVVGILLSGALELTGAQEGTKRGRLSKELRVGAMTGAANEAMNQFLDPLRLFLTGGLDSILDGLPEEQDAEVGTSKATKLRVETTVAPEEAELPAERTGSRAKAG